MFPIDLEKLLASLMALPALALVWLVRTVLTNNKKIALLEAEINRRNEDIKEVKTDVKRLLEKGK